MTTERRQSSDLGQAVLLLVVFVGAAAAAGALSGLYAEELGSARVAVMMAPIVGLGRVLQVVWMARRDIARPAATVVISLVYVALLGGLVVLLARYSGGLGLGRTMRSVVIALIVAIFSALLLALMLKRVETWRHRRI